MATPLSVERLLAALKAEGCEYREYRKWRTYSRDDETGRPFGPVNGVVIHHTAGTDSLALVYGGRSDLPGPLAHAHLAKDGTLSLTGHGRTNHAGTFAQNAHDAVVNESPTHPQPIVREPIDGNDHYYGIEIENLGNGKDPYPAAQYEQAVRWATAICRAHGWTEHSVIGHKEGTRRKIDPTFNMDEFRAAVGRRLRGASTPAPEPPKEETPKPPETPATGPIKGIDISGYQSETPNLSGMDFVVIKATEGRSYVNPKMVAQAKHARAHGRVTGFYHFLWPGNIKTQAKYFVENADIKPGDFLACDWENTSSGTSATNREKDTFIKEVKRLRPDCKVLLYCNVDFWTRKDRTSYVGDGLWIAKYGGAAGKPGIKKPWLIHQYTDNPIDTNVAKFDSRAEMKAWATGTEIQEDDLPYTEKEIAQAVLKTDGVIPSPDENPKNPYWTQATYTQATYNKLRKLEEKVEALAAPTLTDEQIAKMVPALAATVADLLAKRLAE